MTVLDSGKNLAEENMQLDFHLLKDLEKNKKALIHFYDWKMPSITYGFLLQPEKFLNIENVSKHKISLEKRPTGGGVTFHFDDFSFSLLVPLNHSFYSINPLESYKKINSVLLKALQKMNQEIFLNLKDYSLFENFCMAHPVHYDLMIKNKKVGGGAIRRKNFGLLYQGSLSLIKPKKSVIDLLIAEEIANAIDHNSHNLISDFKDLESAKSKLKSLILEELEINHFFC